MLVVRAPLRISFIGGGTDLPAFYTRYPGRVISTTIDKYIYLTINPVHLSGKTIIKYSKLEQVDHPAQLEHDRFRAALIDAGIVHGIEIGTYADVVSKTGLGSSSSFSVALMKGLHAYRGRALSREESAAEACRLELGLLKEPIGKQDQYAAAYGGFNMFTFNPNETVTVEPVLLDFRKRALLEDHMFLFFTGITRSASAILAVQQSRVGDTFTTYKQMIDDVPVFRHLLLSGDIIGMAELLHENWLRKKSLSSGISDTVIDQLYATGLQAGARGGKVLGAGGGGCLLFLAPPETHSYLSATLMSKAEQLGLSGFQHIPVRCTQSGADVLFNTEWHSYRPV